MKSAKYLSLLTAAVIAFVSLSSCTASKDKVRIAALKGPTGIGFAEFWSEDFEGRDDYSIELYGSPNDINALIIGGSVDIAAVPSNVASVLYNKTQGRVLLFAVNTLGVLYILEKGDTVHSVFDLAGKKIVTSGQGSSPEYVTDYILKQNGIENCQLEFLSEHAEVVAQAVAGNADIVLLPEPFVSVLLAKNAGYRIAADLNEEWNRVSDSVLSTGALVINKDFAVNNPKAVETFLERYKSSVDFVNNEIDKAAEIVANQGIVASAEIAKSAIPNCNITLIYGKKLKSETESFYRVLFDFDKSSVGGKLPDEEFYFTAD